MGLCKMARQAQKPHRVMLLRGSFLCKVAPWAPGIAGLEEPAPGEEGQTAKHQKPFPYPWQWLQQPPSRPCLYTPRDSGMERGRALGCVCSPSLEEKS